MRSLVIVSSHPPSRELLARYLAEPLQHTEMAVDADAALVSIARKRPSAVVVDLRRADEDAPLLLGLLRKRYRSLAVICLLPGAVRVVEGEAERVYPVSQGHPGDLEDLLLLVQRAVREVSAQALLGIWRPGQGEA